MPTLGALLAVGLVLLAAPAPSQVWARPPPVNLQPDDVGAQPPPRAESSDEQGAVERHHVQTDVAQTLVFLLQLGVFWYQGRKLAETVQAAAKQSKDMKASIAQATRSAAAMETIAEATKENVEIFRERSIQSMRAYLTVGLGSGIYQDRDKCYQFQARPNILNTGQTPAFKVKANVRAALLPNPLPDDFEFPLDDLIDSAPLAPHHPVIFVAPVNEWCNDPDVKGIKAGTGKIALYYWGRVTYEDVFHAMRTTTFAQSVCWRDDDTVVGVYLPRHNEFT